MLTDDRIRLLYSKLVTAPPGWHRSPDGRRLTARALRMSTR